MPKPGPAQPPKGNDKWIKTPSEIEAYLQTRRSRHPPLTAIASLALLETLFFTPDLHTTNAIFICLDFGFRGPRDARRIVELGISTFDTKHLLEGQSMLLHTENYHCETQNRGKKRNFLRGESQPMYLEGMKAFLEGSLLPYDEDSGTLRNVILVAHGATPEIDALQSLGIDLRDREKFPNLLGFINTHYVAFELLCRRARLKMRLHLEDILDYLEIPHCHLHVSGNDAHLTNKVLLKFVLMSFQNKKMDEEKIRRAEVFEKLIHEPLPDIQWLSIKQAARQMRRAWKFEGGKKISHEAYDCWTEKEEDGLGSLSMEDLAIFDAESSVYEILK